MALISSGNYTGSMSQLTRRDIAEVVGEVLDLKLDEKLDKKLDEKLDEKLGAFAEHLDDKFDSLVEAVSLMNFNMGKLAKTSDLKAVKQDITTIKLAVTGTNRELRGF